MSTTAPGESRRLAALYALEILDSGHEAEYDGIVRVAAHIAKCPIALITLVDADRQWFKAALGMDVRQTSREISFCSRAIEGSMPLIVPDAQTDPLFRHNPMVTGGPNIRFYLGFPIEFMGERLGTLCVIDRVRRELSDEQISILSELAGTVSALFQSRQRLLVLAARDRLLEKLSQEVPGVIYQYLLNPDGSACYPFATSRMREIFGIDPEEVRGSSAQVMKVLHPDDTARVSESIRRSAESLEVWRDEYRVRLPGRPVGWREGHATPEKRPDGSILWHGFVSDITERKLAEAELMRSQQRAALAISTAGLGITVWDSSTNQISFDGATAQQYGRAELAGTISVDQWLSMIIEPDRSKVEEQIREAVRSVEHCELSFRILRADGVIRYLEGHARPIRDAYSGEVQMVGAIRDVTERHEAEHAQRLVDAAEQSNLAKTQLLGRVSHELRTPLNAILGFAQILAQSSAIGGDPNAREQLSRLTLAGWQLLALINGLLELTEAETARDRMRLESVSLSALIVQVVDLLDGLAHSSEVQIVVGDGLAGLWVVADKNRLQQSLINLLSNAIKYNRRGGSVLLDASHLSGNVTLQVSDTGNGLSATQLADLGQPFSRLGAEYSEIEGSGLGLAITRSLVERMGGSLLIRSVVGVGSVFSIVLLAAESEPQEAVRPVGSVSSPSASAELQASGHSPRDQSRVVLYVEDNALNRMVMHGLFEQRPDWRLVLAASGSECMEILVATRPDLILLDMRLPDCTGLELHARFLSDQSLANIPVVAISADALPEKVLAAKAAGILDYWVKPVDLAKVHQFLTQLSEAKH